MPAKPTIHAIHEADIPEAAKLMEAMWQDHANQGRLIDPQGIMSVPGETYIRGLMDNDQAAVFVAEQANHIVGVISCVIQSLPSFYAHKHELYLDDLCVAESTRRQGIASQLIKAAKAFARQHGITVLTGKIWSFNQASQAVFKQQAYKMDYSYWHKIL